MLELPPTSKLHKVFYVFYLKNVNGNNASIQTILDKKGSVLIKLVAILDWREHLHSKVITEVLIQWEGLLTKDATWESLSVICLIYMKLNTLIPWLQNGFLYPIFLAY